MFLMFSCFCLCFYYWIISCSSSRASFLLSDIFLSNFRFCAEENKAFQPLTFKAAVCPIFAPWFSDNLSVGFFLDGANWNNLDSSGNMNESQAFREAAGLHSAAAPYWAIHYTLKQGWSLSHEGNHTKYGGNPLLLPAVVVLLTDDCRQGFISGGLVGELEGNSCVEAGVCVSQCQRIASNRQGHSLLRGDHEARQIQLADCWGKWESAQWLSFMISVWVIPPENERLYTRQWRIMKRKVIWNRKVSSFPNLEQLLHRKKTLRAALH